MAEVAEVAEVAERVSAQGIEIGPIAEMSRARPDGVELHWRLTFALLGPPFHAEIWTPRGVVRV